MSIIKTPGPDEDGVMRGHCYDGPGWNTCHFWKQGGMKSKCMLFGGVEGVVKEASLALHICDEVYGVKYTGKV